ncbi:hypothetical protein JCM11491_001871 [Sporobolomyces phaffii]
MKHAGPAPSPVNAGTSTVVKSLKSKTSMWFKCNSGDFDDERPRSASKPFVSLPVDPFARYTIPSRRQRNERFSPRPHAPLLQFPSPPPRPPVTYRQQPISSPLSPPDLRDEWTSTSIRPKHGGAAAEMVDGQLAAGSLGCAEYTDEVDELRLYDPTLTRERGDEWDSDRGTIFTLFGDAKEWEEFEDALFFLRPAKSGAFNDDSSTPTSSLAPSSQPSSSSSLAFSSSSSASSVYSTATTSDASCDFVHRPY